MSDGGEYVLALLAGLFGYWALPLAIVLADIAVKLIAVAAMILLALGALYILGSALGS